MMRDCSVQAGGKRRAPADRARRLFLSVAALVAVTLGQMTSGQVASARPGETPRWESVPDPLLGSSLQGAEDENWTHLAVRILDPYGAPVAGALVWDVGCGVHGDGELLPADQAFASDTRGWLRLPSSLTGCVLVVSADGYAGRRGIRAHDGLMIELPRGKDLRFEVRDGLDRAIPAARVGYRTYCGHTPDLRQVSSNSNGIGRLPAVVGSPHPEGWLWFLALGMESEDIELGQWGSRHVVLRPNPGRVVSGRVLNVDGSPRPGAYIGSRLWHRGPWTTTDNQGHFRLMGIPRGESLQIDGSGDTYDAPDSVTAGVPPTGTPLVVRLGAPSIRSAPPRHRVDVHLFDSKGAPVPAAEATLWSGTTGWGDAQVTGRGGIKKHEPLRLFVPAGRYELGVDGWPSGFGTAHAAVDVAGAMEVKLELIPFPSRPVDAADLQEDDRVLLSTSLYARDVTDAAREGVVRIDSAAPAILRVHAAGCDPIAAPATVVRVPAIAGGADHGAIVLKRSPERVLRIQTVDTLGRPAPCSLFWDTTSTPIECNGDLWLSLPPGGDDEVLLIEPRDTALASMRVWVASESGAWNREYPRITFLPREQVAVTFGSAPHVDRDDVRMWLVDSHGREPVEAEDLNAGAVTPPPNATLLMEKARHAIQRVPLNRPGPWFASWHRGSVSVRATAKARPLITFAVLIDGVALAATDGVAQQGALQPGRHEVVVSAVGCAAQRAVVHLADGEALTLAVEMPPARD